MLAIACKCNSNALETVYRENYQDEKLFAKQPIEATIGNTEGVCLREILS